MIYEVLMNSPLDNHHSQINMTSNIVNRPTPMALADGGHVRISNRNFHQNISWSIIYPFKKETSLNLDRLVSIIGFGFMSLISALLFFWFVQDIQSCLLMCRNKSRILILKYQMSLFVHPAADIHSQA